MGFLHIQAIRAAGSGVTSITNTVSATGVGHLVVLNFKVNGPAVSNIVVTDNAAIPNTYSLGVGPYSTPSTGTFTTYQYYGVQVTGGATQVTISWTAAATAATILDEFSGNWKSQASVFDVGSTGAGTTTAPSVAAFSPSSAGELIVAGVALTSAAGFGAGSGYTFGVNNSNNSTEYKLSGTTSETAPFTVSSISNWTEVAGAYKITNVAMSGGVSFVGSNAKSALHTIAATLNFVGVVQRTASRALSGAASFVGGLGKTSVRAIFSAAVSFSGAITRTTKKAAHSSLSFVSSTGRLFARLLEATLGFSQDEDPSSTGGGGFGTTGFGVSGFGDTGSGGATSVGQLIVRYIRALGLQFIGVLSTIFNRSGPPQVEISVERRLNPTITVAARRNPTIGVTKK